MIYIALPTSEARRLSFYLAMEEYTARHLNTGDDCFFMWQVKPSVIFGRNQLIEAEVNLDYCRRHGIEVYRRKSGGGCVYADMSNIMFSYITQDEQVNFTFNRYINLVALMLCKLGVDARASRRNDILIATGNNPDTGEMELRKVSGNAFYHIPSSSIFHLHFEIITSLKKLQRFYRVTLEADTDGNALLYLDKIACSIVSGNH